MFIIDLITMISQAGLSNLIYEWPLRSHAKNDITIIIIMEGVNISLSKLVSSVPGCHKSHSRSQAMIMIVKQVSHMREAAALAMLTGEPRGKHGKMATCHEKSRLLLSFFPFFQEPHTRKSQWVVTVTKYRFYSSALPA